MDKKEREKAVGEHGGGKAQRAMVLVLAVKVCTEEGDEDSGSGWGLLGQAGPVRLGGLPLHYFFCFVFFFFLKLFWICIFKTKQKLNMTKPFGYFY